MIGNERRRVEALLGQVTHQIVDQPVDGVEGDRFLRMASGAKDHGGAGCGRPSGELSGQAALADAGSAVEVHDAGDTSRRDLEGGA
jgi:hypothetical protein